MHSVARAEIGRTRTKHALQPVPRLVVFFGLISIVGPSLLMPARAASTPPGTSIVNVAGVTASVGSGSPPATRLSNAAVTLVSAAPLAGLSKRVDPAGTVRPGDSLRYTLAFENALDAPLTGVVLTDPLDPHVDFVTDVTTGTIPDLGPGNSRATVFGVFDAGARQVRFSIPVLPPRFRGEVSFRATLLASIPDETVVRNAFVGITDQAPNGSTSPEVTSAVVAPSLAVSLTASRDRVEVGDLVGFTIRAANVSPSLDLGRGTVSFTLPESFRFREGTLRVGGRAAAAPVVRRGGRGLEIEVGDLPRGEFRDVTLAAVVAAAARGGEVAARAVATARTPSGIPVEAGPARAALRVVEGILSAEAVIAGKVFVDADGDGVQSDLEPGVPGVRIFLEDGTQVLTDVAGKYHIEGLKPGLHVLKLDPLTAPEGLAPRESGARSAGTAAVQFVDLGAADLFKANVALTGAPESMAAFRIDVGTKAPDAFGMLPASVLFERGGSTLKAGADGILEAYAQILRELGAASSGLTVKDVGSPDPALGRERARALERALAGSLIAQAPALPAVSKMRAAGSVVPASGTPRQPDSEEILRALPPGLYVISPERGDVIDAERADVEIAFPTGSTLRLTAGGREVPEARVGVRMQTSRSGMSLNRYVGVALDEGENLLVVECLGPEGPPQRIEIRVDRVGSPARIAIRADGGAHPADGRTPGRAVIEVRDARGWPVTDGTFVTIETSSGSILGADADPRREGFQARTSGGRVLVRTSPAAGVETRSVRARAGQAAGEGELRFGPHLREWIVAGVGQAGWSAGGAASALSAGDPGQGDPTAGPDASARLALFAKGKVGRDGLLSVSYDSSRERDEAALFRTQDPSRLFPVYGDGSEQAYDLESQGRLAVRWEQDRTLLLLGDFRTGLGAAELARYDRALSGALAHVEGRQVTVHAFSATTPQRSVRDTLRSDGSSGPYRLSRRPLVAFSEKVETEARDRFHSERVISTTPLSRFIDYDIDYASGTILFHAPVPSQDDGFNPVTLVVTYESVDAGGSDLVAGGRIGYRPSERFEWGTTAVHEQRGAEAVSLRGMDFTVRPWNGAALTTEYAQLSDVGKTAGALALRFTASAGRRVTVGAYVRDVPADFTNPSMSGASEVGTHKEGVEVRASLPDGSRLMAETFRQEETLRGIERRAAALGWERSSGPLRWDAGAKVLGGSTEASGEEGSSELVRAGLQARLGGRLDASLHRQEIVAGETIAGYPTRTELGAGYRFNDRVRGFLRHEWDQGEAADTQRSLVGVEGAVSDSTTVQSRYSLEDALNGSRGYALLGVRTRFSLTDLWSADVRAERAETIVGQGGSDFTSLSTGAEYLPGKSKFTGRYEVRFGEIETRHLLTAGGAVKITQDLAFFARQRLNLSEPDVGGSRLDGDGFMGLAYRPVTSDRLNWLGRIQALRGESLPGSGSAAAAAPAARGLTGVFELNVQPAPQWHLVGRYAGRYARDTLVGLDLRTYTEVWEARCLADVGRRATAGLAARLLRQASTGTALTGMGVESGFLLAKDLWVVGGYNVTGFSDRRFPDGERRSQGPFLSLRFKFDESLLGGLTGRGSEPVNPAP